MTNVSIKSMIKTRGLFFFYDRNGVYGMYIGLFGF